MRAADGLQPSRAYPESVECVRREAAREEEGQGRGASRGRGGMFACVKSPRGRLRLLLGLGLVDTDWADPPAKGNYGRCLTQGSTARVVVLPIEDGAPAS